MAEISSLKRQRGEIQVVEEEEDLFKRPKSSYKDIITLLEEEEDVPNEDLTSLISTLQEEISSSSSPWNQESAHSGPYEAGSGEDETESVMRHLLEASDDELVYLVITQPTGLMRLSADRWMVEIFCWALEVKGFGSLKTMKLLIIAAYYSFLRYFCSGP